MLLLATPDAVQIMKTSLMIDNSGAFPFLMLHVGSQDSVHAGLVARSFRLEEVQHFLVEADVDRCLIGRLHELSFLEPFFIREWCRVGVASRRRCYVLVGQRVEFAPINRCRLRVGARAPDDTIVAHFCPPFWRR